MECRCGIYKICLILDMLALCEVHPHWISISVIFQNKVNLCTWVFEAMHLELLKAACKFRHFMRKKNRIMMSDVFFPGRQFVREMLVAGIVMIYWSNFPGCLFDYNWCKIVLRFLLLAKSTALQLFHLRYPHPRYIVFGPLPQAYFSNDPHIFYSVTHLPHAFFLFADPSPTFFSILPPPLGPQME